MTPKEKNINIKRASQEILPKGFEYKSNDAFLHDFWVTQLEDGMDKNPKAELVFRGESLRQFIVYQRAVAEILESQARKIDHAKTTIRRIINLSVWGFFLLKFISRGRKIKDL